MSNTLQGYTPAPSTTNVYVSATGFLVIQQFDASDLGHPDFAPDTVILSPDQVVDLSCRLDALYLEQVKVWDGGV